MSTTIIDELIVRLGLDSKSLVSKGGSADKTLKGLEKSGKAATASVEGLSSAFTKMLAVIGGAYAIKAFVEDTIASSAALDRLSKNLGISVRELSAWSNAVEEVGGSAKGLQGTMSMLSAAQTELRLSGQSGLIPYFNALGVAFAGVDGKARPVNDILLDLADRFSHLDRPTANNLGKMMGIDEGTLNVLLQGRREVELMISRQKQFNAVSKEQAEESAKLQKSLVNLRQTFTALGRDLLQSASPALEKFLGVLTSLASWAQNNKEFLKDLAVILGTVAAGLTAISIATSPITLTIAAIVALAAGIALLWQDYQTWKRGGDSLIDWAKWKPGIDAAIAGVKDLGRALEVVANAIGIVKKGLSGDTSGANQASSKLHDKILGWMGLPKEWSLLNPKAGYQPGAVSKAIAQREGFNAKGDKANRGQRNHNPGNIEYGDFAKSHGATGSDGRFAVFPDDDSGYKALDDLLGTKAYAGLTIDKAIAKYAPSNENDTASYAAGVRQQTGASATTTVSQAQMLNGIQGAGNTARAAGNSGNTSNSTSSDHSVSVQTGPITIHTQATDSDGIAKGLAKSFGYAFTAQAASGLN